MTRTMLFCLASATVAVLATVSITQKSEPTLHDVSQGIPPSLQDSYPVMAQRQPYNPGYGILGLLNLHNDTGRLPEHHATANINMLIPSVKSEMFCTFVKNVPRYWDLGLSIPLGDYPRDRNWSRVELTESTFQDPNGTLNKTIDTLDYISMFEPTDEQRANCMTQEAFFAKYEPFFNKLSEAIMNLR